MGEMNSQQILDKAAPKKRKPGRPRAIPPELESSVVEIYRRGYGYRATARILRDEYGVSPDYTTVRRVLRRLGIVETATNQPKSDRAN